MCSVRSAHQPPMNVGIPPCHRPTSLCCTCPPCTSTCHRTASSNDRGKFPGVSPQQASPPYFGTRPRGTRSSDGGHQRPDRRPTNHECGKPAVSPADEPLLYVSTMHFHLPSDCFFQR